MMRGDSPGQIGKIASRLARGIITVDVPPYRHHCLDDGCDYIELLRKFETGEVESHKLLNMSKCREVHYFRALGREFIFKSDVRRERRLEVRITRFLLGPVYSRLIKKIRKAVIDGCDVTPTLYLVRERWERGECVGTQLIFDYLPGRNIHAGELAAHAGDIAAVMRELHRHGLTMLDINPMNFILSGNGIKAIDLNMHYFPAYDIAKDIVNLRNNMGIAIPAQGLWRRFWVFLASVQIGVNAFFRARRSVRGGEHERFSRD